MAPAPARGGAGGASTTRGGNATTSPEVLLGPCATCFQVHQQPPVSARTQRRQCTCAAAATWPAAATLPTAAALTADTLPAAALRRCRRQAALLRGLARAESVEKSIKNRSPREVAPAFGRSEKRSHGPFKSSRESSRTDRSSDETRLNLFQFLSRVKDAQIVLKEKKQKKKFSEPDFLRS